MQNNLFKNFFLASKKIEKYPDIGKIVPELSAYNYREILFKRYRIIYRTHSNIVTLSAYIILQD